MPANDIFGFPTLILSNIGGIEIDAVLNETHHFRSLVTEHPLEDGSTISDHIVNLPTSLEIEGRLTDTPFGFLDALAGTVAGAAASQLGAGEIGAGLAAAGAVAALSGGLPGKAKIKWQELVQLKQSQETFTVLTGLVEYSNMVFETLSVPRQSTDGRSIRFNATLRELIIIGGEELTNEERIVEELQHALPANNAGVANKVAA